MRTCKFLMILLATNSLIMASAESESSDLRVRMSNVVMCAVAAKNTALYLIRERGVDGGAPQVLFDAASEAPCDKDCCKTKDLFLITDKMKRKISRSKKS